MNEYESVHLHTAATTIHSHSHTQAHIAAQSNSARATTTVFKTKTQQKKWQCKAILKHFKKNINVYVRRVCVCVCNTHLKCWDDRNGIVQRKSERASELVSVVLHRIWICRTVLYSSFCLHSSQTGIHESERTLFLHGIVVAAVAVVFSLELAVCVPVQCVCHKCKSRRAECVCLLTHTHIC